MVMSGIATLRKDNQTIKKNILRLDERIHTISARKKIYPTIIYDIKLIFKLKESLLYPRLEKKREFKSAILFSLEQIALVNHLISQIQHLEFNDIKWKPKYYLLTQNLLAHFKHEEKDLYPFILEAFSKSDLVLLNEELRKLTKKLKSGPLSFILSVI